MTYFINLYLWFRGFAWFDTIQFRAGWTAKSIKWWALYTIDYGSHVLTGGAVVSWSRWFYDNRHLRIANFFDRLLNHFQEGHGRSAGPPLWGSKDCFLGNRLLVLAALVIFIISRHMS